MSMVLFIVFSLHLISLALAVVTRIPGFYGTKLDIGDYRDSSDHFVVEDPYTHRPLEDQIGVRFYIYIRRYREELKDGVYPINIIVKDSSDTLFCYHPIDGASSHHHLTDTATTSHDYRYDVSPHCHGDHDSPTITPSSTTSTPLQGPHISIFLSVTILEPLILHLVATAPGAVQLTVDNPQRRNFTSQCRTVNSGIRIDSSSDWIRESEGDNTFNFKRQCNAKVYSGKVSCVVTDGYSYTSTAVPLHDDHSSVMCGGGGGWWVSRNTLHWTPITDDLTPGNTALFTVYYTRQQGNAVIKTISTPKCQIDLITLTEAMVSTESVGGSTIGGSSAGGSTIGEPTIDGSTAAAEELNIWITVTVDGKERLVADRSTWMTPSERRSDEWIQIGLGGGFTVMIILTIFGFCVARIRKDLRDRTMKFDLEWGSGHSVANDYVIVHDRGGKRDVLHVVSIV